MGPLSKPATIAPSFGLAMLISLSLFGVLQTRAHALTAEDLARHLGVQSWETTVGLPPGKFAVSLFEISDGKVGYEITAGSVTGDSHDSTGNRLVVLVSHVEGRMKFTINEGDVSFGASPDHLPKDILLQIALSLPKKIMPGDYILGGMWKEKNGVITSSTNVADVTSGLLLRVQSR